jgi:hypothetical protein
MISVLRDAEKVGRKLWKCICSSFITETTKLGKVYCTRIDTICLGGKRK